MAEEPEAAPAAEAKKSGGGGGFMGVIMTFVAALLAVVAGGFINAKLHPMPDLQLNKEDGKITPIVPVSSKEHGEGGAAKAAIYFAIDPPLVVNFEDSSAVRFLQVTMEVMARDQHAIDGVQKNIPLIRNNLLLLISNRDYKELMSREGKEKLRQESLEEIRKISKKEGAPPIEDLLFTSFVVQ